MPGVIALKKNEPSAPLTASAKSKGRSPSRDAAISAGGVEFGSALGLILGHL
jgi:hypothetical protein